MNFSYFFIMIFIIASSVNSQEIVDLVNIVEEGEVLKQNKEDKQKSCEDPDDKEEVTFLNQEFEPVFEFHITKISGIKSKPKKIKLEFDQLGFSDKWTKLISATNSIERKKVTTEICRGMSQSDAISFAGYIGKKNSSVYDHARTSSGSGENLDELITIEDYFQVHRNVQGIGDPDGRKQIGVCGDSARVVAEFLSSCHFSCSDIDITSYSTTSGGHQMVSARGENGEFFTANWNEATIHTDLNPLQYTSANPNIIKTSAHVEMFDCNGMPKGMTTTPLGTILLLAHDATFNINGGQDYEEIEFLSKKLGLSEVKIKAFRGSDHATFQEVKGFNGQLSQKLGDNSTLLTFTGKGSLVVGKAKRDVSRIYGNGDKILNQNLNSVFAEGELAVNLLRKKEFKLTPFIENSFFMMHSKNKVTDSDDVGKSRNFSYDVGVGVHLKNKVRRNMYFESTFGWRGGSNRNVSQKGHMLTVGGDVERRRQTLNPNHIYGRGTLSFKQSSKNSVKMNVKYDNYYLLGHSQFSVQADQKFKKSEISPSLTILKTPSEDSIKALGLSVSQQLKIKKHLIEVGPSVQYLIINQQPNTLNLNLSVVYKVSGKK